jgi:hypothetical protein
MKAYTAHVLTEEARKKLLEIWNPRFPEVIAHHITLEFGVPSDTPPPAKASIEVIGYASDDAIEAVVVSVNGSIIRPDGGVFHVTLSLDRSKGKKPAHSNDLIASKGYAAVEPLIIETVPTTIH